MAPRTLQQALRDGDRAEVEALIAADADVRYVGEHGYTALVDVLHGPADADVFPLVRRLLEAGADPDAASDWQESPLRVASRQLRFDVVRALLDAGADPTPLRWTAAHRAAALGTPADLGAVDRSAKDCWGRTAFLLALQTGDLGTARRFVGDLADRDRTGRPVLHHAVDGGNVEVLRWLLGLGCDVEPVDDFDHTALHEAAARGNLGMVRALLEAGAPVEARDHVGDAPIAVAADLDVVRLLVAAGGDLQAVSREMRNALRGVPGDGRIDASEAEYRAGAHRRFGRRNPEGTEVPFWAAMVRADAASFVARRAFGEPPYRGAVWCFQRFGQSLTLLPDGRVVEVGGEHEDHYDPDFCIYNDVAVHHPDGRHALFGYPEELFPPTDFHTATLVDGALVLVGSLGYAGRRTAGETQVFRLDTATFAIERLVTTGDGPGWLSRHRARLDGREIRCWGGVVAAPDYVENTATFALDVDRLTWRRTT